MLDLEHFDVHPVTGFLPAELPLRSLPQAYYKPWEDIVANLPALLLSRTIRGVVDQLPLLSTSELGSVREERRAYQVLGFIAHAYVWGTSEPKNCLPRAIAEPLVDVSERLGLPPLATYSGLCLWNFQEIIPGASKYGTADFEWSALATINTFTGSIDESWFYLVSTFFEYRGGAVVKLGVDALNHAKNGDARLLVGALQKLAEAIDELGTVLMRMLEMCDPHVFYFRIRPYLAGWKNMASAGIDKDGVVYGAELLPRLYAGGSNAQLSLIQFLDALLGVHHHLTGERPPPHQQREQPLGENGYLREMREYMPRRHRDFLAQIDKEACIRAFVLEQQSGELTLGYDACLAMLKLFRDKHIQIVTRYIVLPAQKAPKMQILTLRLGLAKSQGKEQKGTGGTSLLPFLKQCRDETGDPAAGSWGKRLLSDGVMRLNYLKPNPVNEDES